MSENLYFLINNFKMHGSLEGTWFSFDKKEKLKNPSEKDHEEFIEKSGSFDEFLLDYKENYAGKKVIVLIDGVSTTYKTVPVTVKNKRQMLQALPFLVEEQIITNIDDMYLGISDQWNGSNVRLALLNRSIIDKIKNIFNDSKIIIDGFYGLPDILAPEDDEIIVAISKDYSLIKGISLCFQCENENIVDFFKLIDTSNIRIISFYIDPFASHGKVLVSSIKEILLASPYITTTIKMLKTNSTAYFLLNHFNIAEKINILKNNSSGVSGEWYSLDFLKYPFYSFYFSLLAIIVFNFSTGFYFNYRYDSMVNLAGKHYLKKFTEETKVVDVKSQIEGKLKSLQISGNPGRFSKIFGVASGAILKVGHKKDITLKQLRYDEPSGELKIDMEVTTISLLDILKKEVTQQGLDANIISANQNNGIVKATLLVKVN